MHAKGIPTAAGIVTVLAAAPASALETYSTQQTQQFMDWCTGAKSATESVCSCTVKSLAQTLPTTALEQFLAQQSGGGGFSLSTTAVTAAAAATNAMVGCSK